MSEQTTEGVFRVLDSTRERDEWLLLETGSADPTYVSREGYEGDLARAVESLEAGNRVDAELAWKDGDPRFTSVEVLEPTRFAFTRTREPLFEDAHGAWRDARDAGEPMASRVLHAQNGAPVGVVYVFADQPGGRDLFEEFRDGVKPLEPLLARLAEDADPPFEAFVIDHTDEPFVAVVLAMERGGVLASTVRETYFGESLLASSAFETDLEPAMDADLELDVDLPGGDGSGDGGTTDTDTDPDPDGE